MVIPTLLDTAIYTFTLFNLYIFMQQHNSHIPTSLHYIILLYITFTRNGWSSVSLYQYMCGVLLFFFSLYVPFKKMKLYDKWMWMLREESLCDC